jgi:ornithine decarboxylase
LAKCGAGFDCASKREIELVLSNNGSARDIVYANPCKQASHIKYALENGVKQMTFDNVDEMYKIKKCHPESELILRILPDDSKSICRFGKKFGASLSIVPELLRTALKLELNIIGISFHVGSGCFDASAFTDAVILAREAFDIGAEMGFNFKLLDIGGGFPGNSPTGLQFKDVAALLAPKIDELFPLDVTVISEPGRYFVCSAFTLAVNITSRRVLSLDGSSIPKSDGGEDQSYMCTIFLKLDYVNDGMYGSFNCITFDHAQVEVTPLCIANKFYNNKQHHGAKYPCHVWGPTCDSIDMIGSDIMLPKMEIGDWLVAHRMGAYTMAAASHFNGYNTPSIIYTNTEDR